jgi:SHS2 domain-containing protein
MQPDWLQELDHTADTGIVVTAPDLPTLFSRAAWGMFAVITDLEAVQPARAEVVEVAAEDLPGLMVRWLSELNFRHVTRHELYCQFRVVDFREWRLEAAVAGEPIAPGRHTVFTEIKAVTFHGLEILPVDAGWRAQIIFDL